MATAVLRIADEKVDTGDCCADAQQRKPDSPLYISQILVSITKSTNAVRVGATLNKAFSPIFPPNIGDELRPLVKDRPCTTDIIRGS